VAQTEATCGEVVGRVWADRSLPGGRRLERDATEVTTPLAIGAKGSEGSDGSYRSPYRRKP
jgi:hypothetical protein